MDNTWVKLYRKLITHDVMQDATALQVFVWCMLHVDKKTGKFTCGRFIGAQELNIKPSTFRDAIYRLRDKYKIIDTTSDNKKTEISLLNWAKYNDYGKTPTQSDDNQTTTRRQPDDNQTTHIQDNKTYRHKNKDIINPNGFMSLFLEEFNKKFNTNFQDTEGRRKKLGLRLKTFTREQMLIAIENLAKSDFHVGRNDRGWRADPDFLIKSDEQIDKWLNYKESEKSSSYIKIL